MLIKDRVILYKKIFKECKAILPVRDFVVKSDRIEALEEIRKLNTELGDLYQISLPVITCWVRDNSYVPETGEIYLSEPELKSFLHQWRHHLQNVERKYERRGLTVEGNMDYYKIPYEDTIYGLRGEDDAIAWVKVIMELAAKES